MLNNPAYYEAVFNSLPQVKTMFQTQSELGRANEEIASEYAVALIHESVLRWVVRAEGNLQLQNELYALRAETKDAFDRAKALEARWKELEREQRDVYQVCNPSAFLGSGNNQIPCP